MRKIFSLFLLISMLTTPTIVGAQFSVGNLTGETDLEILLDPQYPEPNQEVEATLSGDVYGATIVWYVNGEMMKENNNLRKLTFKTGAAGQNVTVTATINSPQSGSRQTSKYITPLYLDIILEPQTHVPSFYLGRPMVSVESLVNATAIVSGKNILNTDLVYTWQAGSEVIGGGSLRGQNKVSFSAGRTGSTLLSLSVSNLSGETLAKRSIFIPVIQPSLLFYESHPLLGLSKIPIKNTLNVSGKTTTVRAEPYFLDSRVFNDPDIVEWTLNNKTYSNPNQNPYEITLEKDSSAGRAELEFHVRDRKEVLQGVEDSVYVNIIE